MAPILSAFPTTSYLQQYKSSTVFLLNSLTRGKKSAERRNTFLTPFYGKMIFERSISSAEVTAEG